MSAKDKVGLRFQDAMDYLTTSRKALDLVSYQAEAK